jgi:hypothetical protein
MSLQPIQPSTLEDNANWQSEIKSQYLTKQNYNKASKGTWRYRKSGTWWRILVKITNLPWLAIFIVLFCSALSGFVVISVSYILIYIF